jgi:predicted transposase/invertase (TIGR01784 family)
MHNTPFINPPFLKYLPFTSDFGFKATFGNENNTIFLQRALQALIKSDRPIVSVTLTQNVFGGQTKDSRGGIYDIVCEDDEGNIFIVEMQLAAFPQFTQRMKFYSNQKMDGFIKRGTQFKFDNLPKIYTIGILDFDLFDDDDYYRSGCIRDEKGRIMDDRSEFIIIELGKFNKKPELCSTDLDKLTFTMKEAHKIRESGTIPVFMQEDWLEAALFELDTKSMSPTQYADMQIAVAREQTRRYGHEWALEEREKKGIEKGIDLGKIEAIKSIIVNSPNWTDEEISKLLSIPVEFVKNVRKDMIGKS